MTYIKYNCEIYLKYSSKIDDISARVQHMVAKINDRRANDQKVMESFQETLTEKVSSLLFFFKRKLQFQCSVCLRIIFVVQKTAIFIYLKLENV